jgi:hypothetical protein
VSNPDGTLDVEDAFPVEVREADPVGAGERPEKDWICLKGELLAKEKPPSQAAL